MQRTLSSGMFNHFAKVETGSVTRLTFLMVFSLPVRLREIVFSLMRSTLIMWRRIARGVFLPNGLPGSFFKTSTFILGIIPLFYTANIILQVTKPSLYFLTKPCGFKTRTTTNKHEFTMNDSPRDSKQDRLERFQEAIQQKWKCEANHKLEREIDFLRRGYGKGSVSVFKVSGLPENYCEARQCVVWDGNDFKLGSDETVAMLDIQVTSHDLEKLPEMAVWLWCVGTYVLDTDFDLYAKSKWTQEELDGSCVQFGQTHQYDERLNYEKGNLFVRRRAAGDEIAVRIIQTNRRSIRLHPNEVERIEPGLNTNSYWVKL